MCLFQRISPTGTLVAAHTSVRGEATSRLRGTGAGISVGRPPCVKLAGAVHLDGLVMLAWSL